MKNKIKYFKWISNYYSKMKWADDNRGKESLSGLVPLITEYGLNNRQILPKPWFVSSLTGKCLLNNAFFRFFTFMTFILLLASGCKQQQLEENQVTFSMSDSMYKRSEFAIAKTEVVKNEIRLFGKIAADNKKTAQVFPAMGGVVQSIRVELGDYVKQGQILATVQSSEVAGFQKEKRDALNDVSLSEKNLEVAKDLFAGKLNAEKDVIAARKDVEKAKAELARINQIHSMYRLNQGSIYQITAPISGFIVTRQINRNEQLRSDVSEPIFSISEINEVWVLANVNESDISKIVVGHDTEIRTLAFPDTIYRGKIDKIFNTIDPDTKSMKVRVKIPNADLKLKPEMNCTVSVKYSEGQQMVTVPSSAVIFEKSKYWVMVFKDRRNIETRKIEVYRQLGDTTYVQSGIEDGETVISENGLLIYDALND